VKEVWESFT